MRRFGNKAVISTTPTLNVKLVLPLKYQGHYVLMEMAQTVLNTPGVDPAQAGMASMILSYMEEDCQIRPGDKPISLK